MNQKIDRKMIISNFFQMREKYEETEKAKEIEILEQLRIKEKRTDQILEQLRIKEKIGKLEQLRINDENKEEIKIDIANKQIQFLATINFDDIKIITIHKEFTYTIYCLDHEYDVYNQQIIYSIEYNNGIITDKKEINKKVFSILYTKLHFIEFIDDIEIIHFYKI